MFQNKKSKNIGWEIIFSILWDYLSIFSSIKIFVLKYENEIISKFMRL